MNTVEALSNEVLRVLGTINGTGLYDSNLRTIKDAPIAFESVGERGFPAASFEINRIENAGGSTGIHRLSYTVDFYLYAKAKRGLTPMQSITRLVADVERALVAQWKLGTTRDNIRADSPGAQFIEWDFSGVGVQVYSAEERGEGIASEVSFSAIIHRGYDTP